jgi:hypothetical protein
MTAGETKELEERVRSFVPPQCPDCKAKQETIDKLRDTVQMNNHTADYLIAKCDRLRTALVRIMGGDDTARLDHIEAMFSYWGIDFIINRERGMEAIKALRETKP